VAERQTNEKTINHVGKILGFVNSQKDVHELDPVSISGQIKRDAKANSNNNKNEK
jgi:hypothetical protein